MWTKKSSWWIHAFFLQERSYEKKLNTRALQKKCKVHFYIFDVSKHLIIKQFTKVV